MENTIKKDDFVMACLDLAASIIKLPLEHVWIDYDKEADVLYLSFRKPQRATKTLEADDILIRKEGHEIVGITILNASSR